MKLEEFFLESDAEELIRLLSMPIEELEEEIELAKARGKWICGLGEREDNDY